MSTTEEEVLLRIEGTADRMIPASMLGGWPLPERLAHFPISDVWMVPNDHPLPPEADGVVTYYRKISESQLPAGIPHMMRGAQYEVEV